LEGQQKEEGRSVERHIEVVVRKVVAGVHFRTDQEAARCTAEEEDTVVVVEPHNRHSFAAVEAPRMLVVRTAVEVEVVHTDLVVDIDQEEDIGHSFDLEEGIVDSWEAPDCILVAVLGMENVRLEAHILELDWEGSPEGVDSHPAAGCNMTSFELGCLGLLSSVTCAELLTAQGGN